MRGATCRIRATFATMRELSIKNARPDTDAEFWHAKRYANGEGLTDRPIELSESVIRKAGDLHQTDNAYSRNASTCRAWGWQEREGGHMRRAGG